MNYVVNRDFEYVLGAYEANRQRCADPRQPLGGNPRQSGERRADDRSGLDQLGDQSIPIRRMLDGGVPVALSADGVPYWMLWTAWEAIARWDEDGQR